MAQSSELSSPNWRSSSKERRARHALSPTGSRAAERILPEGEAAQSLGADDAQAGEPPAGRFRGFLSKELAELQDRVLEEFEYEVGRGLRTQHGPRAGSRDQDLVSRASTPLGRPSALSGPSVELWTISRQGSDGSEDEAAAVDRWAALVSNLLVEDGIKSPDGMTVANRAVKVTCGSERVGTADFFVSEEEEADDRHWPHSEWLDTSRGMKSKGSRHRIADSRIDHEVSLTHSVDQDPLALQKGRCCLDRLVIHPDSSQRVAWCSIGVLLLIYDAFTVPMEAVDLWSVSPPNLLYLALGYWVLDFIAHLLTGYHHDVGVELRVSKTAVNYAKGWLTIDLAIITLDVVFLALNSAHGAGALRLVRTARFARLIRLHKSLDAAKSYMRATQSALLDLVVRILRVLGFLLLICHLTACVWFGVGRVSDGVPDYFVEGSWVEAQNIEDKSNAHKYAMALHWSITQFTPATNNIVPVSTIERLFSVGVVLVGMVVFSAFLSSMTSAVNELKSFSAARTKDRHKLVTYMKNRIVSPELSHRVLFFFDTLNSQSPVLVENDLPMLCQLPESARICLHGELYLPLLRAMTIISRLYNKKRRPIFLDICHRAMTDQRFVGQQEIFVDGVEATGAYLVAAGKLEYSSGEERGACLMPLKSCLAECAMWLRQWHHRGSLLAHTPCSVVQLDCSVVRQTIRSSSEVQVLRAMKNFAVLFAHHVQNSVVTDLGPDAEAMADMCGRAMRFCKLEPSYEAVMEEEQTDMNFMVNRLLRWSRQFNSAFSSRSSTSSTSPRISMRLSSTASSVRHHASDVSRASYGSTSSSTVGARILETLSGVGRIIRYSVRSSSSIGGVRSQPPAIAEEREA